MSKNNSILVVAPHPDDEILGCGGTIIKYALRNYKVIVLIVSRGKTGMYPEEKIINVRQEARNAHQILKVYKTIFLDFPAPDLDTIANAEISSSIFNVIKEFEVEIVFLPHRGDIHHDHKAVFNAGLVASRPINNFPKKIYSYETLSETEWAAPSQDQIFIPNIFVNISDEINYKLGAMKCYKSQLREFPNPRSLKSIESLANLRGSTVGVPCAEAFMAIRIIED